MRDWVEGVTLGHAAHVATLEMAAPLALAGTRPGGAALTSEALHALLAPVVDREGALTGGLLSRLLPMWPMSAPGRGYDSTRQVVDRNPWQASEGEAEADALASFVASAASGGTRAWSPCGARPCPRAQSWTCSTAPPSTTRGSRRT
jgi:hypothetical protein